MIRWLAPLAWLGLITMAVPVIVHLLSRHAAPRLRVPTLRFLAATRHTPTQQLRLSDRWLLLLRMTILALAVAALAQPQWATADHTASTAPQLTRAVIVDTSASMRHRRVGAGTALTEARRVASALADSASVALVLTTAHPRAELPAVTAWLTTRTGPRELVIVSDLQRGTLRPEDLQQIPPEIGIRIVPITGPLTPAPTDTGSAIAIVSDVRSPRDIARTMTIAHTIATAAHTTPFPIRLRVTDDTVASPASDSALTRAHLEWVARFGYDPLAPDALVVPRAIADTLELRLPATDAAEHQRVATLIAAWRASSDPTVAFEDDSVVINASIAHGWDRSANDDVSATIANGNPETDARWVWVAVLLLLAIETAVRRPRQTTARTADAA